METSYSPSLDEYWENARVSIAMRTTILPSIFSTGDRLPDHILQKLDDFFDLVSQTARIMNDVRTFQSERDGGELASFVECHMNEQGGCSEEEALNCISRLNEEALTKLNYHFLMRSDVPKCYRTLLFNTARIMQFVYRKEDGFSNAAEDLKDSIKKSLFEPVL